MGRSKFYPPYPLRWVLIVWFISLSIVVWRYFFFLNVCASDSRELFPLLFKFISISENEFLGTIYFRVDVIIVDVKLDDCFNDFTLFIEKLFLCCAWWYAQIYLFDIHHEYMLFCSKLQSHYWVSLSKFCHILGCQFSSINIEYHLCFTIWNYN